MLDNPMTITQQALLANKARQLRDQEEHVTPSVITPPPFIPFATLPGVFNDAFERKNGLTNQVTDMRHKETTPERVFLQGLQVPNDYDGADIVKPRAEHIQIVVPHELQATIRNFDLTQAQLLCVVLMLKQPWLIPNKAMAEELRVSPGTVKTHVSKLIEKFGAYDRFGMLQKASSCGFEAITIIHFK